MSRRRANLLAGGLALLIVVAAGIWIAADHRGTAAEQAATATISGGDTGVLAVSVALLLVIGERWMSGRRRRREAVSAGAVGASRGHGPDRLSDADFTRLGVRRPLYADQAPRDQLPYAPRGLLDDVLDRALRDHPFVLVHGPSAAGKSRSAVEAARRQYGDRPVIVPDRRPNVLHEIIRADAVPPRAVIWLDDLNEHLDANLGAVTVGDITRLLELDDVRIVGTMRASAFSQTFDSQGEIQSTHRGVLDLAERVEFPAMDERDRAAAAERLSDHPDVVDALARGMSLGEYLSAGPELVGQLGPTAPPEGLAVVHAAAAWFRAGMSGAAPDAFVRAVYPRYLVDHLQGAGYDRGRAWAAKPVSGARIISVGPDGGITLHDYVIDHLTAKSPKGLPAPVWDALAEELAPNFDAIFQVAVTAVVTHDDHAAGVRLIRLGAEAGHPLSRTALGWWLLDMGTQEARDEALWWLRTAAESDDTDAMRLLGQALLALGQDRQVDEPVYWLRRAADRGDEEAATQLLSALVNRHRPEDLDEAEPRLRAAADSDPTPANHRELAALLIWRDTAPARSEAAGLLRPLALSGDPSAQFLLFRAFQDADPAEAGRWLDAAAKAGHPRAATQLGLRRQEAEDFADAERWFRMAAQAGESYAMMLLAVLLVRGDDGERLNEGVEWATKSAEAGNWHAVDILLKLHGLAEDESTPWLRKAAAAGHPEAATRLAMYLVRDKGPESLAEARPWLRRAADAGSPDGMCFHGWFMYAQDGPEHRAEALTWLRRSAEAGSAQGMLVLGAILREAEATESEGREWIRRSAELGEIKAMNQYGKILLDELKPVEALAWWQKAAARGDAAAQTLVDKFREYGLN
ncbi:tetratricopeptide repeat protein [Paractinoplanes rhizophilus]|uniref:Tetratricopeptide repeat protein n=1 Tax=Paractinoplanes rhizophilus TaxID=1416877 RepID=A0ABW2HZZ6_9ACTN